MVAIVPGAPLMLCYAQISSGQVVNFTATSLTLSLTIHSDAYHISFSIHKLHSVPIVDIE
jgi:hypothetical protein